MHSSTSRVGLAAIQIANKVGATLSRSHEPYQEKISGSAHVIASAQEDLEARLKAIAGPGGVRVVLDPIGGPIVAPLTAAMGRGGILLEFGGLSTEPTPFPLFTVLKKSLTLRGYLVHEIIGDAIRLEAAKAFILEGLAQGSLRPVIARTFSFDEIVKAHPFLESNEQYGKIVVRV